jgi:hypothetical protein
VLDLLLTPANFGAESFFPDMPNFNDLIALGNATAEATRLTEVNRLSELFGSLDRRNILSGRCGSVG